MQSKYVVLTLGLIAATTLAQTASFEQDGNGKTIPELYQAALQEGGDLTIYAGGDEKNQQDNTVAAFKKAFPKINLKMSVDLSKYQE